MSLYATADDARPYPRDPGALDRLGDVAGVEFAIHPEPPTTAPDGTVVLAVVTDSGVHAEAVLPVDHPLLPDLLARIKTRVRAVAPGVTLPKPWSDRRTPPSALRPEYRGVLPTQPALTGFTTATTTEPTEALA